jgi:twitching motility two-component system response regulator PilH
VATILIADDSATVRVLLTKMLAPLGHRILCVSDGEEAARALTQSGQDRPDLVLLDVVMPKQNGFELCRALKSDPATARIKVFFVTSLTGEPDRYWGMKQGADEYITKPVDPQQLLDKVRAQLSA